MLSTETTQSLTDAALLEMQGLTHDLYTPMTREEWERNQAIVEKVLSQVLGKQDTHQAN